MNAQEKVLEYAKSKNNTITMSDEALAGKMAATGARISQFTVAKITRIGNEIIITETTSSNKWVPDADGRIGEPEVTKSTVEVLRVSI